MSTSAIGTVLDDISEALSSRPGLQGVSVFSGPVSVEEAGLECVAFGNGTLDEIAFSMGGAREETWTISGETRVVGSWEGSTEGTIKAARDRALEIFAEVEEHLNDTYPGDFPEVELTGAELVSSFTPDGRECRVAFDLTVKAIKNP